MQEIEKVKMLQSEREALKKRAMQSVKETERKSEEYSESVCPECGSRQLVHDYERAELVCQNCGLVIDEDFIDHGPEWRAFDNEQREKRSRTGSPMTYTMHDKGLSTTIGWTNRDA
jgi:transcription initiation factor TFIIB